MSDEAPRLPQPLADLEGETEHPLFGRFPFTDRDALVARGGMIPAPDVDRRYDLFRPTYPEQVSSFLSMVRAPRGGIVYWYGNPGWDRIVVSPLGKWIDDTITEVRCDLGERRERIGWWLVRLARRIGGLPEPEPRDWWDED